MTRRGFLRALFAAALALIVLPVYAFFVEPAMRLRVTRWRMPLRGWRNASMKIAVLSDIHMGAPWMTETRLARIVARTNALGADLVVFLGDLNASHRFVQRAIPSQTGCAILADLVAPLGVYAVLGNHDWWDDQHAQARQSGPCALQPLLEANGITVLENTVATLANGMHLAGLGDQWAFRRPHGGFRGIDDLPATLAQIPSKGAAILLAHEPDIFPEVPKRIALTLSGHTHGGQIRLFGWSPRVPSRFGNRYAYGHIRENGRNLVVSGGLGCSILPLRLGVVPEITVIEIEPA